MALRWDSAAIAVVAMSIAASAPGASFADEGGSSFWYPGTYGSLAALRQEPGWSLSVTHYHATASARGFTGGTSAPDSNYNEHTDQVLFGATYVFATPFVGAQASVGMSSLYGRDNVTLAAGSFAPSDNISQSAKGFGDLFPVFSLRWSQDVNNLMIYVTGDIPIGVYNPLRLAYLGLGHGAIDAGGAYTYFNSKTGHEFSGTLGFTYNFVNPSTHYQSGVDMHFDWGASHFLTERLHVGLVGYVYKEIGCDSGFGNRVGCFRSQVAGIGPQIGFIFPFVGMAGYLSLRVYKEFDAKNRPDGWNAWVSFELSSAAPSSSSPLKILTK
ncbi:MAG TPA: transporter [Pseudolabrys sp.]|nr:transporter [Pseudolabrys sp.]